MGFGRVLAGVATLGLSEVGRKDAFGRKDAEIKTKSITDINKERIGSPLSKFLAGQIGQGVPRFKGNILTKLPQAGVDRANEFLNLDSEEFFNSKIQDPAINQFKELLGISKEDFAGQLSGSGRFRSQEEQVSRFTRDLASTKAQFELSLPQAQLNIASQLKAENDKEAAIQYQDWLKSLPSFNPALQQSISFLQESTNTGTTVLSFLDEGREGILGDLLKAGATLGSAAIAACWTSAEIFGGWYAPKTCASRHYISTIAPTWLRKLYLDYGAWLAGYIANKPLLKATIKPVFEYWAWKGGRHGST